MAWEERTKLRCNNFRLQSQVGTQTPRHPKIRFSLTNRLVNLHPNLRPIVWAITSKCRGLAEKTIERSAELEANCIAIPFCLSQLNSIPPWWCRWYAFKKRSQAGGAIRLYFPYTPAVCQSHCFPFSCGFVKKFPHTLEEFVCLGNRNRYLGIGGKDPIFPFRLGCRVQTSYKYVVCVTMYGPRVDL